MSDSDLMIDAYDDSLKRVEKSGSSVTTLVWDGSDYLQGRN